MTFDEVLNAELDRLRWETERDTALAQEIEKISANLRNANRQRLERLNDFADADREFRAAREQAMEALSAVAVRLGGPAYASHQQRTAQWVPPQTSHQPPQWPQ